MFAPLGLFKSVACPEGSLCAHLNCIFLHDQLKKEQQALSLDIATATASDPSPNTKRRKLANDGLRPQETTENKYKDAEINDIQSTHRKVSPPPLSKTRERPKEDKNALRTLLDGSAKAIPKAAGPTSASLTRKAPPKESLNPRMLKKAPAAHSLRSTILVKLHSTMKTLNEKMAAKLRKDPDKAAAVVLCPEELIVMALDEEQKIAVENPTIYGNVVKLRIVKLSKMTLEDWEKEVLAHLNARYYKVKTDLTPAPKTAKRFTTDLAEEEEIAIARMLRTELKGKEEFGYITKVPTEKEVADAKMGLEAAQGWERCDRCAGRFQVFPGRREDGILATGGSCTFHPAKIVRPTRKATDHITGHREAYFPCCNETVGTSAGCTEVENHVFKVSDPKRLAAVLQFVETPPPSSARELPRQPVTFDCEMGYTTLGMEVIRLTALSWPHGDLLLDVLVKPFGEILDLNSRFSGVFPEHFARAVPYGTRTTATNTDMTDGETNPSPMQVVDSPAVVRTLLLEFLDPDTPLIGHGIENDLNVVRLIHPTVIDTVLLYPHTKGLPVRYGLKHLAKVHLDRDIQMGGDKGHDSKEDCLATSDLVRFKVAEKAKVLKRAGWTISESGRSQE